MAATGMAQTAPVPAVPNPAAPAAPGNVEECRFVNTVVPQEIRCAPGTDPDGFQAINSSIVATVEAGSQVQGVIDLGQNVTVIVDGDMVVDSIAASAIDLDINSTVVNNGFIGGDARFDGFIVTGDGSSVTNNGTISDNGNTNGVAIQAGVGSTVVNNGDIFLRASNVFGIIGDNQIVSGDDVTVLNTGRIVIDGQGALSAGIRLGNNADVTNEGLIQTFGDTAEGILVFDDSTVVNGFGAFIFTTGQGAEGISAGDNADVRNFASGQIFTFGDDAVGVLVGQDSFVETNGNIVTAGANAGAIQAGNGATIFVNSGQVGTNGDNADAIAVAGSATIDVNGGLVQAAGAGSRGIDVDGDLALRNRGRITAVGDDAVYIAGVGTVINFDTGFISSDGGDGLQVDGDGSTVENAGVIQSRGGSAVAAAGDDLTLDNTGTIQAFNDGNLALVTGDNLVLTNSGTISTTGDNFADVITAGDNAMITNSGTISATGTDSLGVVAGDDLMLTNSGTISTSSDFGVTVSTGNGATIANDGDITVDGDGAFAVSVADMASITNGGMITVTGDDTFGLEGFDDLTLVNSGTIAATGANAIAVSVFADSDISNTGAITASGADSIGINAAGDGTLANEAGATISGATGLLATAGAQSVTNFGTIEGTGGTGVDLGDGNDSFIQVDGGAVIGTIDGGSGTDLFAYIVTDETDREFDLGSTTGFEDVRIGSQTFDFVNGTIGMTPATGVVTLTGTTGDAFTVINTAILAGTSNATVGYRVGAEDGITLGLTIADTGMINTTGDAEIGFDGGDDAVLVNDGSITTTGMSTAAVLFGDNGTLTNTGSILSEGVNGVAVATGDNATIDNAAGATINTTGDNGFGIVINGGGSVTSAGVISVAGATAQAITITGDGVVDNSGIIGAADGRAIDIGGVATITNQAGGVIGARGVDAIRMNSAGSTLVNAGSIENDVDAGVGVRGAGDTSVTNTGTITTSGMSTASVVLEDNGMVTNEGTIEASGDAGIAVVLSTGGTLTNAATGSVTSSGDGAPTVVLTGDATISNDGTISASGADSQAVTALGDFDLTNAGTISGDDGRAIDVAGIASITNADSGVIAATGSDAIRFNSGSSITNNGAITGERGIEGSAGDDFVANFGSIDGTTDGVDLGFGADTFQQWTGASVTGNVLLGGDDDLFVLEGSNSTVTGNIDGGTGTDTAILAGILDADNMVGFEEYQLGSTLGDTLNDLVIDGNRTLDGDVVAVGETTLGLGVDTLTATGEIRLLDSATITIETPLDEQLVGQTVAVLIDGTGFSRGGATVNIIDDDALLDYNPVIGSLSVRVNAVNPLAGNSDPNLTRFGAGLRQGIEAGTLSAANFAALNGLTNAQVADAANDALPSLSDGVGREVFETSTLASIALDRHLAADGSGIWGQIAVRGAEQDALSATADGYDSDQVVFTVGGDFALGDDIKLGLIASYADIEIQDETATGAQNTNSDVQSIKLGAYIAIDFFDRGFVNSEIAYLTGEVDAARGGFFGPIASSYDFDGLMARTTIGYDLLADEGVSLTPTVGVNVARVNFDDTVESGGFGFAIERGDAVYAETRFGLELGADVSEKVSGFISGTFIHDFVDSTRSFNLSSAQLGTFNAVLPLREQDRFEISAGATIDVAENFGIGLGYQGDFNDGYSGHSARASVRIAF
ncbi:MAG: hypothetical protein AAF127_14230 [Pseudomonadota bacterium]